MFLFPAPPMPRPWPHVGASVPGSSFLGSWGFEVYGAQGVSVRGLGTLD